MCLDSVGWNCTPSARPIRTRAPLAVAACTIASVSSRGVTCAVHLSMSDAFATCGKKASGRRTPVNHPCSSAKGRNLFTIRARATGRLDTIIALGSSTCPSSHETGMGPLPLRPLATWIVSIFLYDEIPNSFASSSCILNETLCSCSVAPPSPHPPACQRETCGVKASRLTVSSLVSEIHSPGNRPTSRWLHITPYASARGSFRPVQTRLRHGSNKLPVITCCSNLRALNNQGANSPL